MLSTEEVFLTSLHTAENTTPYLLYADWLDEQHRSEEALYIRLVVQEYSFCGALILNKFQQRCRDYNGVSTSPASGILRYGYIERSLISGPRGAIRDSGYDPYNPSDCDTLSGLSSNKTHDDFLVESIFGTYCLSLSSSGSQREHNSQPKGEEE